MLAPRAFLKKMVKGMGNEEEKRMKAKEKIKISEGEAPLCPAKLRIRERETILCSVRLK